MNTISSVSSHFHYCMDDRGYQLSDPVECDSRYECSSHNVQWCQKVICSGKQACELSTISGIETGYDYPSRSHVKCSDFMSCFGANFYDLTTVECSGQDSCFGSTFHSVLYVKCNGEDSCQQAQIGSRVGLIHCIGENSCYDGNNKKVGEGFIDQSFGDSDNSMEKGDPFKGILLCDGENSCGDNIVSTVTINLFPYAIKIEPPLQHSKQMAPLIRYTNALKTRKVLIISAVFN